MSLIAVEQRGELGEMVAGFRRLVIRAAVGAVAISRSAFGRDGGKQVRRRPDDKTVPDHSRLRKQGQRA
jgi:hypothetical protein